MKVSFIGHASILIETRGLRILSDPWWRGPCFGAQWWNHPMPCLEPVAQPVDYIYISHGHHDHFHPGTLRTLARSAKVLVSSDVDLADAVRAQGFDVLTLGCDEELDLGNRVKVRIVRTHGDDSMMALTDGEHVCVNLNDALHSAPEDIQQRFIGKLKAWYPRIDYVFCGYGVASHFPNCYVIPGKDREASAISRQAYFNRRWARIIARLQPRYGFPFAADVAFLEEDLVWANDPTHNGERPTDVFEAAYPDSPTQAIDIAPGFEIRGHEVTRHVVRQPVVASRLCVERADAVARANAYGSATREVFDEVLRLLLLNLERCRAYLRERTDDYRFLLRFRNFQTAIEISKQGDRIEARPIEAATDANHDLVFVTRLHYLKASLATTYGHEILFVGSGCIFRYADAAKARRNLHRELMMLLRPHAQPPALRFGRNSPLVYRAKQAVKRALGLAPPDLYDLGAWTVWLDDPAAPAPAMAGRERVDRPGRPPRARISALSDDLRRE